MLVSCPSISVCKKACVSCAMMQLRKRTVERLEAEAECACSDIVTGLILCGVPQFTKVMPESGGAVKIPDGFVAKHRDTIGRQVTLEPKDAKGRVFDVALSTKQVGRRQSALFFGAGWGQFRSESEAREGDLLIFALVASSQFVVYILRGHREVAEQAMARSQPRKSPNPKRILKAEDEPVDETKNRHSYFVRRLHANAFVKGRGKRGRCFEFPQAFLRMHHDEVGDIVEFVVSNKREVWLIETFSAANGRVFLSTGWLQFLEDNGLQQGDDIAIALVAHSKFLVTVVERASENSS